MYVSAINKLMDIIEGFDDDEATAEANAVLVDIGMLDAEGNDHDFPTLRSAIARASADGTMTPELHRANIEMIRRGG